MDLFWLQEFVDNWRKSVDQGRVPHAVMLAGLPGTGKRATASWLSLGHLGKPVPELPCFPCVRPEVADLHWLTIPEDRKSIGVDQVRGLIEELSLTSYEGAGKVAVIEPADAMTTAAANSLLKTLEEPSGNALLILVVDRPGRLPATIVSRCQRHGIRPPSADEGVRWLEQYQPGTRWQEALQLASGAPLAAIDALLWLDDEKTMRQAFDAVGAGNISPLRVAKDWAGLDPELVLNWLARQVQARVWGAFPGVSVADRPGAAVSVASRIDRRKLFCYLDSINRLRAQPPGSFNVQLTFECLLIDWAQGLTAPAGTEYQI